jgi:tRNA dimethylallyltransferase
MPSISEIKPLVVLLGPTASGKTDAAIQIANIINGEIISCDSRLFYRGMDIGTAKPSREELSIIPHHMIDIADPDQPLSLAVYQEMCKKIIDELHQKEIIPILVGGTGQYIYSITEAWQIPEQIPDDAIRNVLEKLSKEKGFIELFRYLEVLDPIAAISIDKRNIRRVIRALEVIFMTGHRFSVLKNKGTSPYRSIQMGIQWPREALYRRIDLRIDKMLIDGLVKEVEGLLNKGYTPDLPGMSAIGYNEITLYLLGKLTLDEAVMLIKRKTRQFVRRQSNWFKLEDPQIYWFPPEAKMVDKMVEKINTLLRINE